MRARVLGAGLLLPVAAWPCIGIAATACIPAMEASHAKVRRVAESGVIDLADGRAVRLEGVRLPGGANDHAPQVFTGQALSALGGLTAGHVVTLAVEPPREDRYGRIRAQVTVGKDNSAAWVQRAMLRKGLARVSIAPDRPECAAELYAAEQQARAERAGIWSSAAYAVRNPSQVGGDVGTFQIVEGTIASVSRSGGRVFLDFGSDFAATISSGDVKHFHQIGVDPFAYANQTVRLRGFVERIGRRPEIEIATPVQIEIVETAHGTIAPAR